MKNFTFALGKGWRRKMRLMKQMHDKEKAKEQEKKKFDHTVLIDRRPKPLRIKSSTKLFEEKMEVDIHRRKRTH